MRILKGTVTHRLGVGGRNLASILGLIGERMAFPGLIATTFSIQLEQNYLVHPDAIISEHEYNGSEHLKLQRCRIAGIRAVIMRPNTHEDISGLGHGRSRLDLLSNTALRDTLGLQDGDAIRVEVEGDAEWWRA